MSEFKIQSDSVDVEQIMEQIRSRIRDKRGVDYTEDQIKELAGVKLDRFLDPKNVRSDLLKHYRQNKQKDKDDVALSPPIPPGSYDVDPDVIYRSSRGISGKLLYGLRRLLKPILKLFFNPDMIVHILAIQKAQIDWMVDTHVELSERFEKIAKTRVELDALTYEVLNNLVVEMTRLSIDVKNHKMRVESVASRLDFDERRARALEKVVAYRPNTRNNSTNNVDGEKGDGTDSSQVRRRRRRRRGRRRAESPTNEVKEVAVKESPSTTKENDGNTVSTSEDSSRPTGIEKSPDTTEQ
tara:strand:+ start:5630 stop:6520 length:891 start_codon:yes stop_codon:yes gene_type:complete